jgi:hypothetical protein
MLPESLKLRAITEARKLGMSFGEYVRQTLANHFAAKKSSFSDDPFFQDREFYDGDVPTDISINHDKYLYEELNRDIS